jgi:hypothetical protein
MNAADQKPAAGADSGREPEKVTAIGSDATDRMTQASSEADRPRSAIPGTTSTPTPTSEDR